jgi:hypothetical protein
MRIEVTQKHIDEGDQQECATCPVALAVRDALGLTEPPVVVLGLTDYPTSAFRVEVSYYVTVLQRASQQQRSWSIPEVREFVANFDADERCGPELQPFTFDLPGLEEFIAECKATGGES